MSSRLPPTLNELKGDGLALNGERYLGMPVIAYAETIYVEGPGDTLKFSTHWSTPTRECVRLFSEEDVLVMIQTLQREIDKKND